MGVAPWGVRELDQLAIQGAEPSLLRFPPGFLVQGENVKGFGTSGSTAAARVTGGFIASHLVGQLRALGRTVGPQEAHRSSRGATRMNARRCGIELLGRGS
jgi:hypothetical protein